MDSIIYNSIFSNENLTFNERLDLSCEYAKEQVNNRISDHTLIWSEKNNDLALKFFMQNGINAVLETSPFDNKTFEDFINKKGFIRQHDGSYLKGFLKVLFLNDFIEIKVDSRSNNNYFKISRDKNSLEMYFKYLDKFTQLH